MDLFYNFILNLKGEKLVNKLEIKYLMGGSAFFMGVILNGCGGGNSSFAQTSELDSGVFNQELIINNDNKPLLNFITGTNSTESSVQITLNNISKSRVENIKLSLPQKFSLNRAGTNSCEIFDHQLVSGTLEPKSSCNLIVTYNDPSVINKTIASLEMSYNIGNYNNHKAQSYELYYSTITKDFQWQLLGNSEQSRGDNFIGAWTAIRKLGKVPGESVTIAVIDTGYTPHPNYISNFYENESGVYGYDFKEESKLDGLDSGDFVAQNECGESTPARNSGWHGSHVTGMIVGNGLDRIYGGAYGAKVVPIRALGKCGGTISSVGNSIMWAINEHPTSANPHPVDIINLSLGGGGECPRQYQDAINQALAKNVIVVVSAGNSTDDVSKYRPANCKGVISVAALAAKNKLSSYSNYGNTSIAAAGGDGRSDGSQSILSAIWNSKEGFNINDGGSYGGKSGTSMAAPSVSAAIADIISLMKAYNNPYTPEIIEEIIKDSAQSDFQKYSTDLSKSITSKRLDVESAVKYTINNYLKINN